jgi:DNA-binding LytR/AlgR family response regulator
MSKPVKISLVEDELLVAEDFAAKLRKVGYDVIGLYSSGEELLENIAENVPDLLILDIHLAGSLDGIQTAEQVGESYTIPIIYVTDDFNPGTIDRAKQTRPTNYITKPYNQFDLNVAIEVAFFNTTHTKQLSADDREQITEKEYLINDAIFIKEREGFTKLQIDSIIRIEADRACSKVITKDKTYLFTGSLSTIDEQLTEPTFLRVHRSHVVNIKFVTGFEGNMLELGDEKIPVSQSHRDEVFKRFRFLK